MSFKVLVCGGRDFNDDEFMDIALTGLTFVKPISLIIHGGARGADSLAGKWAEREGVEVKEFRAEWNKYGRRAGYIRNVRMAEEGEPDLVVAFPGGRGTDMMIDIAKKKGISVWLPGQMRLSRLFGT